MSYIKFLTMAIVLTTSSYLPEAKAFSLDFLKRGFFHCFDGPSACTKRTDLCANQAAFDECYEKCVKVRRHDSKTPIILDRLLKCSPEAYQKSKFLSHFIESAKRYGKEVPLPTTKSEQYQKKQPTRKALPEIPTKIRPQIGAHRKPLPEIPTKPNNQETIPEKQHKPLPDLPLSIQKKEPIPEPTKDQLIQEEMKSEIVPPPPPPPVDWKPKKEKLSSPKAEIPLEKSKKESHSPLSQDLLGDIQKGAKLKKIEPTVKSQPKGSSIAEALQKRRIAIADDEEEDDEEDDELSTPSYSPQHSDNKGPIDSPQLKPEKADPKSRKLLAQPKISGSRDNMLGDIRSFDPKKLRRAQPTEKKKESEVSSLFDQRKIDAIHEYLKDKDIPSEEDENWDD